MKLPGNKFESVKRHISAFLLEDSGFIRKDRIIVLGFISLAASLSMKSVMATNPTAEHHNHNFDGSKLVDYTKYSDGKIKMDQNMDFGDADYATRSIKFSNVFCNQVMEAMDKECSLFPEDERPMAIEENEFKCSNHLSDCCSHESDHFNCGTVMSDPCPARYIHDNDISLDADSGTSITAHHEHVIHECDLGNVEFHASNHFSSTSNDHMSG